MRFDIPVVVPYRLDLTAAVLRRLSTNVVDRFDADGVYRRALETARGIVVMEVVQSRRDRLSVRATGTATRSLLTHLLKRMLATSVDVRAFRRVSRDIPWLSMLAARMSGVHPPRYPTLWEACVNAVVFQQISLFAAGAMMRRFTESLGTAVSAEGAGLYTFPSPHAVLAAGATALRAATFSAAKTTTLLGIAEAVCAGRLTEAHLQRRPSAEASALLQGCKGIGPWTAALILLRGLGRLDVFPERDSGAARSLALATGGQPVDISAVLERLGDQRGMLYYHLLLARLEARGDLPSPPT